METVIVERRFDMPTAFAPLQAAEDAAAWCLAQHEVRALHSYLSFDGLSMLGVYAAPDAEAVRETQRRGGISFERAWSAEPLLVGARLHALPGRSTVVVERALPQPLPKAHIAERMASAAGCFTLHRAEHLASYLSRDGLRLICVFDALDTDSVRMANQTAGVPVARIWPATFHAPEPGA